MINFKEFFEQEQNITNSIALLPGGFKPPTKGHFEAFKYILENADKGVVFVGKIRMSTYRRSPARRAEEKRLVMNHQNKIARKQLTKLEIVCLLL